MRSRKQQLKAMADWVLPPNIFKRLTMYRPSALWFAWKQRPLLKKNAALHNRHAGARCFILCNGPSVKMQNIRPLKNEIVFSVSSGYLHPDFAEIAPRYHCVPQITYTEKMTAPVVLGWLHEMDQHLGKAEIFLSHQEWQMVSKNNVLNNRTAHYLCLGKHHMPMQPTTTYDLTTILPRAQSAPVMALILALAMGFKEIYLLGTDHDWFVKKEYVYAFEPGIMKDKDNAVGKQGAIESNLLDDLPMIEKLWSQYRSLRLMAEGNGVKIFNATHGGMLDEFPRVQLEDVVNS